MARSSCVKCGGNRFEMTEQEPSGSAYKYMFIQCSSCGGVAGVTEYFNVGVLLRKVMVKLGISLD
jgi:hypothetical protein